MKIGIKSFLPIVIGLVLGIIFGITTKKLAWYVPSGIVVGVIVAISLNKK